MADLDTIKITQDNITTTYLIKDTTGRERIEQIATAATPDTEIALLRAGLGSYNGYYPNAYDAINAVIPRWKVCS